MTYFTVFRDFRIDKSVYIYVVKPQVLTWQTLLLRKPTISMWRTGFTFFIRFHYGEGWQRSCRVYHAYTEPIVGPRKQEDSFLIGRMNLFSIFIITTEILCSTHNIIIECNILQFLWCKQDKNSYQDENPPIGVDRSPVPSVGMEFASELSMNGLRRLLYSLLMFSPLFLSTLFLSQRGLECYLKVSFRYWD